MLIQYQQVKKKSNYSNEKIYVRAIKRSFTIVLMNLIRSTKVY